MADKHYDLVVIGGGAAGSTAAKLAARRGKSVALVERDKLGGTCLNYGCDPTKALLHAAHVLYQAQHADDLGVVIPKAGCHWGPVKQRVKHLITSIRGGSHEDAVRRQEERGIALYLDDAAFESPHTVRAGNTLLQGNHVLVATGYRPAVPPIDGLSEAGFITNREAAVLESFPDSMVIIGGGPLGLEFAQIFSRFGARVTVLEVRDHVLERHDPELADMLADCLRNEGVCIECGATVQRVENVGGKRRVVWFRNHEVASVDAEIVLLAAGRKPNLDTLRVEAAGLEVRENGLRVDDFMRTNVSNVWAAGDVTGAYPFTHVASEQAKVALHNMFGPEPRPFDYHCIPFATYTYPALAQVGDSEKHLHHEGVDYRVLTLDMASITRTQLTGETAGKIKLFVSSKGALRGASILGVRADELIAPIVLAMRHGLDVRQLADTLFSYPTITEGIPRVAAQFEA